MKVEFNIIPLYIYAIIVHLWKFICYLDLFAVPTNPDGISVKETPSLPLCVYYHNRSNPSAADEELFVKPTSISVLCY